MSDSSRVSSLRERVADFATILVAALAILVAGSVAWTQINGNSPPLLRYEDRKIDGWEALTRSGHRIGPEAARLQLLEFIDYECPSCRAAHQTLAHVRATFPDDLSILVRHFPLSSHPNAYFAARLAECGAQQGKFEQIHDLLLSAITLERLDVEQVALEGRLPDVPAFLACVNSIEKMPRIEEDIEAGITIGLTGVPSLILEGTLLGTKPDSASLATQVKKLLRQIDPKGDFPRQAP